MRLANIYFLLLFASIPVCGQAVGTGTITGRVITSGKGVSGCVVTIWKQPFLSPDGIGAVTVRTDGEGTYRLALAPGSYYASVEGGGFYETENGTASRQLRTVTILQGEVSNLDFEVVRGGVITGKITNPDNAPVIEITVSLLPVGDKPTPVMSERQPSNGTNARTDDRGIYRLFGITPGR